MVSAEETQIYRRDAKSHGRELSREEREKLLTPYLPPIANVKPKPIRVRSHKQKKQRRKPIRSFLKVKFHALVFFAIHLIFSVYLRLRHTYHAVLDRGLALLYYHHRTPEFIQRDVKILSQLPEHLSVIVTFRGEEDGGIEALMDDVAELCAWCTSAGIPLLSVYEKTGILKPHMRAVQSLVSQRLSSYFGSSQTPQAHIHAPNYPSNLSQSAPSAQSIDLLLLSSTDGRDTLVDLTRTLAEMSQTHKILPRDITQDLIDAELSATTSITHHLPPISPPLSPSHTPKLADVSLSSIEPDLLIIFGPYVKLDGYPPWQLRLTEIFCVGDSGGVGTRGPTRVEYQGFLRGLWKFARAEMRFGR